MKNLIPIGFAGISLTTERHLLFYQNQIFYPIFLKKFYLRKIYFVSLQPDSDLVWKTPRHNE